jgi:GNAT superfamily N-acetyltransferase
MGIMRDIARSDRGRLAPLFVNHRHLRPDVDAVLQGYCGSAIATPESDPHVAQLTISLITFFGGDPTHPFARHLVERLAGEKIIIVADEGWRELVYQVHGARISAQPRLCFSPKQLNLAHLHQLTTRIPVGVQLQRINLDLAQRMSAEVSAGLILPEVFPSPADFVERGIGFCALVDEQIVCGATSAARCDNAIEIQINTNPSFRRMGLATAVGAALVAHCLQHSLYPDWETAANNAPSQQLARRLGYIPESTYEWLVLPE